MNEILTQCRDMPERRFAPGEDILREGERSGVVYILIEGEVEILKGDLQVTTAAEPGAFFGEMSALLDEIIAARKARAIEYEEYLKRVGDLAKRVETGHAEDTPEQLKNSPALRALYNNLKKGGEQHGSANLAAQKPGEYSVSGDPVLNLALKINDTVKRVRSDGWRGVQTREQVIKQALYGLLNDVGEVERLFLIIKAQGEY